MFHRTFIVISMALLMCINQCTPVSGFTSLSTQRNVLRVRPQPAPSIIGLSVSVDDSKSQRKVRDPNMETKRIQFMYNQLKGNSKENQMRATAAENRVRMLQAKIQELEKQVDTTKDVDDNAVSKEDHDEEISSLMEKIHKIRNQREQIKAHSKKQLSKLKELQQNDRLKWELEMNNLRIELNNAKEDLKIAQEDLLKSQSQMDVLEKEMVAELETLKIQAQSDYDEMKSRLEKEFSEMEIEYEEKLSSAGHEIEELRLNLQETKDDMATQLFANEKRYQAKLDDIFSQLLDTKSRLQIKENEVASMEEERSSIRRLARLQFGLLKDRIRSKYQSIKRRF